ncbi:MAG: hypothetical protein IJ243_06685 [Prevotella sp.]|nr:hypothetical protein [Prevotella sp.]
MNGANQLTSRLSCFAIQMLNAVPAASRTIIENDVNITMSPILFKGEYFFFSMQSYSNCRHDATHGYELFGGIRRSFSASQLSMASISRAFFANKVFAVPPEMTTFAVIL